MKSFSNFLTLLLALAGCVVAIVLTVEKVQPKADIGCRNAGGDCEKTINSAYGHVGPIPTSLFGLGMYVTVAGLCLYRFKLLRDRRAAELSRASSYAGTLEVAVDDGEPTARPIDAPDPTLRLRADIRRLDAALWGIAALAVTTSWWLQYVSLWSLIEFCPWCMTSAILVTLIFLLTTYDFLIEGRKLDGEQKLLAWVTAFIVICFSFVLTPVVVSRIQGIQASHRPNPQIGVETSKRDLLLVKYLAWRGDPNAKIMMIEFADYQCPHCKKAAARVEELLKSPPKGPIRFAFRNFPLDAHQQARPAAMAAEAASKQGKFWEMHDLIFKHQDELGKSGFTNHRFEDWAGELKLDMDRFKKDSESQEIADRVVNDHVAGEVTGLTITPSFYIITPTQITLLSGIDALEAAWKDPNDKAWK